MYEILSLVGSGGMGEVYRARDTKLGRDVALKILPASFTNDPERVARFRREAQVLASLNHPRIAQIHGLEESNGTQFLVLELVEGGSLDRRIAHGRLPVEEAIAIATQVTEALGAAHDKGVIHRDLKPANIALTRDGNVKVLDFGLAKAVDSSSGAYDVTNSPTLTSPAVMTGVGVILGTAAYMSPEQAKGRSADKRSDIWAFGCVLYEMLAGRRAFADSDDAVSTLASIVKDQPAFAALPTETPGAIHRLLRRCLEKDPRLRLADIADARFDLSDAVAPPQEQPREAAGRSRRVRAWQAIAVLAIVASIASLAWPRNNRSTASPAPALPRIDVDLGSELSLESIGPAAILSPDGTRVVFVSKRGGEKDKLFTRRLDEPTPTELAGTEGAHAPFFSPDGQWVGFFADGKLKKARVDGSRVTSLCDAAAGRGASWSDDGSFIVAALDTQSALSRVPAEGGSPAPLTRLEPGERTHRWPLVLPGRNAVVFILSGAPGTSADGRLAVSALDRPTGNDHRILIDRPAMYPRYVATGHLMFVSKGTIYALALDPDRLDVTGGAAAVLDSVANYEDFGSANFDIARSGTLLYHRGETVGMRTIAWLDAAGALETVVGDAGVYIYPKVSPDGRQIAYGVVTGTTTDIWVDDWHTHRKTRLTEGPGQKTYPVWSPDGRYVVFVGSGTIRSVRADGSAGARVLLEGKEAGGPYAFSPDGKFLAYVNGSTDKGWSLMTVPITESPQGLSAGAPDQFVDLKSGAATPAFSPDGHWLAYTSNESGTFEVYVRAFPGKGTKAIVSSGGGMMPMWSRNGREIFYRTEDQRLMAVSYVVKDGSFVAESPRVWSAKPLANLGMTSNVDLGPDGRFAVLVPADPPEPLQTRGHFTLVLNFADDIRRRFGR